MPTKKTFLSSLMNPQLILQLVILIVTAGVGWGVLKAQVAEVRAKIVDLDNRGTMALQSTGVKIQEQLEELKRQNAVIHSELKNIREILEIKTSPQCLHP